MTSPPNLFSRSELCDFWLFEMLKGNVKGRALQTVEEILEVVTLIWNGVTFE
jgi:hypothetical protein